MTNLFTVKTKLLLATSMLLVSQQAVADSDTHSIGLLFGGFSSHMTSDADYYKFNESHNMVGVILDDKYILATLENSYYRRSTLVAYNHTFWDENLLGVDLSGSVSVGLITGYNDRNEMGDMYLGEGVSVHVMPTFRMEYKLNNMWTVGFNQSILPARNGAIYFNNFTVSMEF